jgi:hypothetical protein
MDRLGNLSHNRGRVWAWCDLAVKVAEEYA